MLQNLTEILLHYGVKGEITGENTGPMIKQIEFLPAAGTKIKNITSSLPDIAREMGVTSLRVEAIAGTSKLGFEVPAAEMKTVNFSNILNSAEFKNAKGDLPLCLGVDISGQPVFADLAKMPHLLIAGTTGSGKSVGLNSFILSLIARKKPSELKFVLIDPKRIEFSVYNNQRYMLVPVVTDNRQAADTLAYLVNEMEHRYALFEKELVRNIGEYHERCGELPYIVCVIDEFADLMAADKSVEISVQRLAQKARAAGIHLLLATQRPSVDVVTGVLKANFPTRLSYKVASQTDSRTILDMPGAEELLGRGDSLYLPQSGELKRIHGAYVSDNEISSILEPYRAKVEPLRDGQIVEKEEKQERTPKNKEKTGIFRRALDWWSSLKVRERKTIINGALYAITLLLGQSKNKTRRR